MLLDTVGMVTSLVNCKKNQWTSNCEMGWFSCVTRTSSGFSIYSNTFGTWGNEIFFCVMVEERLLLHDLNVIGGPEVLKVSFDYENHCMWRSFQVFRSFLCNITNISQNHDYWSRTISIYFLWQLSSKSETFLTPIKSLPFGSYNFTCSGLLFILAAQVSWHPSGLTKSLAYCW